MEGRDLENTDDLGSLDLDQLEELQYETFIAIQELEEELDEEIEKHEQLVEKIKELKLKEQE